MGLSMLIGESSVWKVVNPEEVRYHTSGRCRETGVGYKDFR